MDNIPELQNQIPPMQPHRHKEKNGSFWALILILVGVILLVQNLHLANFEFHWWALFIFIPVFGSLSAAWGGFRQTGRFSATVRGGIGSAIVIGTVAFMLLFGMDWSRWWPLMIIAPGISMFLNGLNSLDPEEHKVLSVWVNLAAWVGAATILLGAGFLVKYLPIPVLQPYLVGYRWWAVPILIVGLGALIGVLMTFLREERQMSWASWSMLLVAVFTIAVGLLALFALDWNLLFPIVLIACGIVVLTGYFTRK